MIFLKNQDIISHKKTTDISAEKNLSHSIIDLKFGTKDYKLISPHNSSLIFLVLVFTKSIFDKKTIK